MKPKNIITILLILIFICIFLWLFMGDNFSGFLNMPTDTETLTPTFTATNTATATFTPTSTNTPTATPTSTPTKLVCSQPLTPENGTAFGATAKVTFSWTEMDTAASYILKVTMPSGDLITFEREETEVVRFIEAFTQGGEYQWNVTALSTDGKELCNSSIFTFIKPFTPIKPVGPDKKSEGDSCLVDGVWICPCPPDNPDCWGDWGTQ